MSVRVYTMKTADFEQIHAFWITIWNFLVNFKYVLALSEVQKAVVTINKSPSERHPFWEKFKEALWTLVHVPKHRASSLARVRSRGNIPTRTTREWLGSTIIEIEASLKSEFDPAQPESLGGTNYTRCIYNTEDFMTLGNISRRFPGHARTPFECDASKFPLTRLEQFVRDAEQSDVFGDTPIIVPRAENIFNVLGCKGPMIVSIRKHLDNWHMRRIQPGDRLHGPEVFYFA